MTQRTIRVVVADDSALAREMLVQILASDPQIEVAGVATDGQEAVELVASERPDLVTMDIHMPRMDGLAAIEHIMAYTPVPILVVSSSVYGQGVGRAFDALEAGALEVMRKPEPRDWADLQEIAADLIRRVKLLSRVPVITHLRGRRGARSASVERADSAGTTAIPPEVVAIGSSTGGPSALLSVLGRLPADYPLPILVAQHIADGFVPGLVAWLDAGCQMRVVVAGAGMTVLPGVAYFAPTGANLTLERRRLCLHEPEEGQLHVPSADTLLESVAHSCGPAAIGVILTGMGADGARGLKLMRDAGATTIAQDEETSTVFGMPKAAVEREAVSLVLPVHEIPAELERLAVRGR
ncbi:MAG: chemotaxis-specific protein-glutamate methyltransferase CheB [Anaerosomatales bacterium]|nr:chemotaxis-specific protein-glutamate methyltransferase CheB [Anaerosomatales bacterium]MDT8434448.1 chemotaxis-specific protein-glutamate methyltransferase CheB [Anaerosomatales bacterium]